MSDVTDYVDAIDADLRPIAERVRELIREELPQAEEAIKWRQPTYTLDGQLVCYFTAAKDHVTLGFAQGRRLDDPDGLLEGSGKQMAHLKLRQREGLDEGQIRTWLRQAIRLSQTR